MLTLALFTPMSGRAQPDYPAALWNPAYSGHWYTTGSNHSFCVIHDMEGYYLSTISYFQQSGTQASAHFCVNSLQNGSDGQSHAENNPGDAAAGQVTQMVREQYYAWHALCWNRWSFGTEHEGFASNPAWYSDAMYAASAALQRHLCDSWGIPKDRNHIIAHGEYQNANWVSWMAANFPQLDPTCGGTQTHTDPGPFWNWSLFMSLITNPPTANTAPVLAAIGDKTVTETTPLTFTASATDSALGQSRLLTDFEPFFPGTTEVMFRNPSYSGSSRGLDTNVASSSVLTTAFPAGHGGSTVLKLTWGFLAGAVDPWLRLTTFGGTGTDSARGVPNPVVDFKQMLKFDIYADQPIKVGLGLRETTTPAGTDIGANGGSAGTIEWVGVSGKTSNGAPLPVRTVAAGSWQTLRFDLSTEPVTAFTGNGVLSTPSGLGVLEHLAIVPTSSTGGPYHVYLDNFSVVYSNVLTFSLDPGAPAGASINPRTGLFSWTPTRAQAPNTYNLTARVTDSGSPPLSDAKTFNVTVLHEIITAAATASGGVVTIRWNSIAGNTYRVQYKSTLSDLNWTDLVPDVTATGTAASCLDSPGASSRVYRVVTVN